MRLLATSLGGEETKRLVPGFQVGLENRRRDGDISTAMARGAGAYTGVIERRLSYLINTYFSSG